MAKKKISDKKVVYDYIKAYPTQEDLIVANVAHLIRYYENQCERNRDFMVFWQKIKTQTHLYLENIDWQELGTKEYKNVVDTYMKLLNHTRPDDEDAVILQLLASLEHLKDRYWSEDANAEA